MDISKNLETSLKRLKWLVSKKGNSEDIEAFNSLLGYVTVFREKQIKAYPIIGKFFLHNFLLLTRAEDPYNALDAVNHIKEIVKRPLDSYFDTLQREVPNVRFEMLYMDLCSKIREARRIAEKNKIPAKESETLRDKYREEDLAEIIRVEQEMQRNYQRMLDCLASEYTREEAEYFYKTQLSEIIILNND